MSSSDPTSNFDSLTLALNPWMFQPLLEKHHLKGPTEVRRQHPGVPVPKVIKGRDKGDAICHRLSKVCQKIMTLVGIWQLFQLVLVLVQNLNHCSCFWIFPSIEPQASVHNTFEYHDQRSQQVNVGIDPIVFSNMASEARRVIQESEEKTQGLEQLAQEAYQQTCCRTQGTCESCGSFI